MSDPLAPARGCINGALIGTALLAGAITGGTLIYLACWQLIP